MGWWSPRSSKCGIFCLRTTIDTGVKIGVGGSGRNNHDGGYQQEIKGCVVENAGVREYCFRPGKQTHGCHTAARRCTTSATARQSGGIWERRDGR